MKLHNTLTGTTNDFKPLHEDFVGMYSCGPTLYDRAHIGNLNSFIVADILRRAVESTGVQVKHVMNFTDVDDKTIRASQEKYSHIEPLQALLKLADEFGDSFLQDMKAVGNDIESIKFVKATDNIAEMQELILKLYRAGFAYISDDGIYFSIEAYKNAGKKYGQLLDISVDSTSQARIQNDEYDKDSVHDFVLWKAQKPGEPAWDFEIDTQQMAGRPGWHIECSAMSTKMLGREFDIHTGGVDLVFPHHENEIAQSTAIDSDTYANFFVHNEHLLVEGRKMSKSLGNFFTLQDVLDKGFDPLAFRMLVLQSHYKNQANFSWDNLVAAANRLKSLRAIAVLRFQAVNESDGERVNFEDLLGLIVEGLHNDLDTPQVLARLSQLSDLVKSSLVSKGELGQFESLLQKLDDLLGFNLLQIPDIQDRHKQMISDREQARANQDWAQSDQLRDELLAQSIELRDTPQGTIWSWN